MSKLRVVLDTNILISTLLTHQDSPPKKIFTALKNQEFISVSSQLIFQEIEEVLNRPSILKLIKITPEEFMDTLVTVSLIVPGKQIVEISKDPDDNMFLAAAWEGQAQYIVSGDKSHLLSLKAYKGIKIITPHEFIEILSK